MKNSGLLSNRYFRFIILFLLFFTFNSYLPQNQNSKKINFDNWKWTKINETASWEARAGLQVVEMKNKFYLFGGRTPLNPATYNPPIPGASTIHGDVWKSSDYGENWEEILPTETNNMWPARAYFQALRKDDYMYIIGGQNFNIIDNPGCQYLPPEAPCTLPKIASSDFFNDVWRSKNGVKWEQMTANAPWAKRAGLSAVVHRNEIYVMGGSVNDDSSITPQGPARIYFNDVWKSKDGRKWKKLTKSAGWSPRAGGIAVSKDDYIYMIGGEDGFICNPQTPRCPPYYNDVWRSKNGKKWEIVTESAEWSSRPGHQVLVVKGNFVLFGGFGLDFNYDPFSFPPIAYIPSNPMDIWVSKTGKKWKKLNDTPWNANVPSEIKYDFDAIVVKGHKNQPPVIYSFGGDRETFDFFDPFNYLNVDNDVWKFSLPESTPEEIIPLKLDSRLIFNPNYPNPFYESTTFSYTIPMDGYVQIDIYDKTGRVIKKLVHEVKAAGYYEIIWDGRNDYKHKIKKGIYIAKIRTLNDSKSIKIILN